MSAVTPNALVARCEVPAHFLRWCEDAESATCVVVVPSTTARGQPNQREIALDEQPNKHGNNDAYIVKTEYEKKRGGGRWHTDSKQVTGEGFQDSEERKSQKETSRKEEAEGSEGNAERKGAPALSHFSAWRHGEFASFPAFHHGSRAVLRLPETRAKERKTKEEEETGRRKKKIPPRKKQGKRRDGTP